MDIKNLTTNINASRNNDINKPPERSINEKVSGSQVADTTDRVTLTDNSSQVRELEVKAQSMPVDNSVRIAELKSAIADGSYQVDAQKVADKLMQSETLLAKVAE